MRVFVSVFLVATASIVVTLGGCTSAEEKLIATAQEATAAELRDPTSAVFTNVTAKGTLEVCGEVNAKNGFGAYEGKSRFTYHTATGAQVESDGSEVGGAFNVCVFDHDYRECKGEVVPNHLTACGQHLPGGLRP